MKMLRSLLVMMLLSTAISSVWAQGKAEFVKTDHNFGVINEEAGKVSVNYEFYNRGDKPITVMNVQPSCGCTTPIWTKEPVAPGQKGVITAEYDPYNRPGKFEKTVNVYTDGDPGFLTLKFSGEVTPRAKGVRDFYPVEMGNLRFKTNNAYFQQIYQGERAAMDFWVYNQSAKPIAFKTLETVVQLPKYIKVEFPKTTLAPTDSVALKISFDAKIYNDWDYVSYPLRIQTDDAVEPLKTIYISANVVENFGNLTADSKLPVLGYDRNTHSFGKIKQGATVSSSFKVSNTGNAPLILRKVKGSCGCTVGQPKKTTLAPGESTTIEVSFNSTGKQPGKQVQNITVIANDPARPKTMLTIEAEIEAADANNTPKK